MLLVWPGVGDVRNPCARILRVALTVLECFHLLQNLRIDWISDGIDRRGLLMMSGRLNRLKPRVDSLLNALSPNSRNCKLSCSTRGSC